ncbi:MAG TPA: STAS/SEC14 domain-containing protein [Polyangiaceae bacterium]|nr:STAS/SEC14 domain-containing protein [Polyangiaceae bacterium]
MSRNMVTRRLGNLLILRQNTQPPSDEEWDECLNLLSTDVEEVQVLVITDGGGPSPEQRRRLDQTLNGSPVRVAVVSESVRIRFIVSSVAFLTRRIKSFSETEYTEALAHLELDLDQRRLAQRHVREMTALIERT